MKKLLIASLLFGTTTTVFAAPLWQKIFVCMVFKVT